ncbi:Protein kinase [Rhodococcus sp. RD6.2]|uniref:serine/threonine-protein kinase n=1 Tax=Rhodococcus sp. RD6.2 TaxID=260936 RepID=UPI00063B8F68|nr:serine/threonine-protein kinase [Rhodococcus sp. RD6.2]CRK52431.1 Protein kinase [Rhodococcus sp. RD6.2]
MPPESDLPRNPDPPDDATVAGGPPTAVGLAALLGPGGSGSDATTRSGGPSAGVVVDTGVARLVSEWEEGDRPPADLRDFLPDTDAIRRAALIELVMVDLAYRWIRVRRPKRIADYCLDFPELLAGPIPPELVYEEYRVRRLAGEDVHADDYVAEFPEQAERFVWLLEHDPRSGEAAPSALPDGADLRVGERLDDFDLVAELGHGAFARVFLARQTAMQRWVALKLSRNVGAEPQTLAQLDHPYIVRVYDQRVLEDRRLRALFMEYVPGGTLLDLVRLVRATPPERRSGQLVLDSIDRELSRKGVTGPGESSVRDELAALSWPETVAWIGLRLAEALEHARSQGILHRDVKPANVLLTAEGIPKLADFNVSSGDAVAVPGSTGVVAGSLAYMSPEQLAVSAGATSGAAADARIDTRSDIYSLGVMMWELLTGARPFPDDDTPAAALERRRAGVAAVAAALPDGCPPTLRRVLLTALEPEPRRRWSTGRKLARQFALCLDARARDLVDPRPGSTRSAAVRWTVPIMLAAIGIPNLLATGYNYYYNRETIVGSLSQSAQNSLEQVHLVIGLVAFPLAAVLILWWCRLAITVPRQVQSGGAVDAQTLGDARRATLDLGHRSVAVAFAMWLVAGIVYPISLQIVAGGIPAVTFTHLIASLSVCGAVAVAYPYFILTFYAVRSLYPVLLSHGEIHSDDGRDLRVLGVRSTRYLAVAASVPLVGVAGLTFAGTDGVGHVEVTVRVLCLGGIVGFIIVYQLFRRIEADLRALQRVVMLG